MITLRRENGLIIQGKAWEIRTWLKQQLTQAKNPHAPLLSWINMAGEGESPAGQVIPFPNVSL